jgi:DNA replication and repair protein RecF
VRITRLELTDFRNYHHFTLEPSPALTVLLGPNAAGKTNAIEAIQLVTSTHSFRRPLLEEVVRWGAERAEVSLRAEEGPRLLETDLEIDSTGHRAYRVNGQPKRRLSEISILLPSIVFTPDDLRMVKGPAERRRSALDDLGEQMSSTYGALRREYGRVVRHRNALLREGPPASVLAVWDEQLVSKGASLICHRVRLLARVMSHAARHYAALAGTERLGYSYADKCGLGTCSAGGLRWGGAARRRDNVPRPWWVLTATTSSSQ